MGSLPLLPFRALGQRDTPLSDPRESLAPVPCWLPTGPGDPGGQEPRPTPMTTWPVSSSASGAKGVTGLHYVLLSRVPFKVAFLSVTRGSAWNGWNAALLCPLMFYSCQRQSDSLVISRGPHILNSPQTVTLAELLNCLPHLFSPSWTVRHERATPLIPRPIAT